MKRISLIMAAIFFTTTAFSQTSETISKTDAGRGEG